MFTLIALMPPVVIAVFVHDVGQLVALTVSDCMILFSHLLLLVTVDHLLTHPLTPLPPPHRL